MRPSPMLSRLAAAFALALLAPATAALAQTGPFPVAVSWWLAGNGTNGILASSSTDTLIVDVDGSGFVSPADTRHWIPLEIRPMTKRLSPSRRTLYAWGSAGGCGGTKVYFYTVPPANNAALQPLTNVCIPNGIAHHWFFDQPGAWTRRTAALVASSGGSGSQNIFWIDLNTGANSSSSTYTASVDSMWFAPSGIAALVKHDADADAFSDYSVVNLCPGSLGQIYNTGGAPLTQIQGPTYVRAEAVSGGGGIEARLTHSSFGSPVQFAISDCSTPPPGVGACCLPGGGCIDGFTEAQCDSANGAWNSSPTQCATANCPPPPTVTLGVSAAGPASAPQNSAVTYTLSYSNTGNTASSGVSVANQIPNSSVYVSSSPPGTYNAGTRQVTWALGTLGGGAGGQVAVSVLGPCGVSALTNDFYSITGTPGGTVYGTVAVTTTMTAASTAPVTAQAISTPLAPEPLQTGQLVRHRVKLTNTVALARDTLRFSIRPGNYMELDAIQSTGTGSVVMQGTNLNWTGSLAPLDTTSLVFTTKVMACRPPVPSENRVNDGAAVFVRNVCSQIVGFAIPNDTTSIATPPWSVKLLTTNLGPQQTDGTRSWNVVRPGGAVDLRLSIGNAAVTAAPLTTITLEVPAEFVPSGNPPFIGTPPPGATWDDALKTLTWSGTPAALDTVDVDFRVTLPSACRGVLAPEGSFGSCFSLVEGTLEILSAPLPPTQEHLVLLTQNTGLRTFVPGTMTYANLLCMTPETSHGLARSPNGDFWIAGFPVIRYNPTTLLFRVYGQDFFKTRLDMDFPNDVAVDSTDTTVVFAGYKSGIGMRVRRYKPNTDVVTTIWNEPSPPTIATPNDMLVDRERRIVIAGSNKVLRINPAAPNPPTTFTDASVPQITAIALDNDGNYVTVSGPFGSGPRLAKTLDRTSGAFASIADLTALGLVGSNVVGAAVAANGDVYVTAMQGTTSRLRRQPAVSGEVLTQTFEFYSDMVRVPGPGPTGISDRLPVAGLGTVAFAPPAPNPSRGHTLLRFTLPMAGQVELALYDVHGRRVRRLIDGVADAGEHQTRWDGRGDDGAVLGAGLYFAKLVTPGARIERRIALIR